MGTNTLAQSYLSQMTDPNSKWDFQEIKSKLICKKGGKK